MLGAELVLVAPSRHTGAPSHPPEAHETPQQLTMIRLVRTWDGGGRLVRSLGTTGPPAAAARAACDPARIPFNLRARMSAIRHSEEDRKLSRHAIQDGCRMNAQPHHTNSQPHSHMRDTRRTQSNIQSPQGAIPKGERRRWVGIAWGDRCGVIAGTWWTHWGREKAAAREPLPRRKADSTGTGYRGDRGMDTPSR